jgi:hypothetical protein
MNHVVAIAVPAIPVVAIGSFRDFVLCLLSASTNRRHLALLHFGDTLRCGNLSLTFAHDNNGVAIGPHFYADNDILVSGMNGDIRRIDLRLGFALIENAVVGESLRQLNLNVIVGEVCNIDLRVRPQAKNIGEVKLHFGASTRSRRNLIAIEHGLI